MSAQAPAGPGGGKRGASPGGKGKEPGDGKTGGGKGGGKEKDGGKDKNSGKDASKGFDKGGGKDKGDKGGGKGDKGGGKDKGDKGGDKGGGKSGDKGKDKGKDKGGGKGDGKDKGGKDKGGKDTGKKGKGKGKDKKGGKSVNFDGADGQGASEGGEGDDDWYKENAKSAESEKAKKTRVRDPLDWDEDCFPKLADRPLTQAVLDPVHFAELRAKAQEKMKFIKGADTAELDRKWNVRLAVVAIENNTNDDWNVFLAATLKKTQEMERSSQKRLSDEFKYTKSYRVKKNSKKTLKQMEVVFSQKWTGSYKKLWEMELVLDVWMVSASNFNQVIGTARKTLYEIGCENVSQSTRIRPVGGKEDSFDVGLVHLSAVVSEQLYFSITASNWQYAPRPELQGDVSVKQLKIAIPTQADGRVEVFQTKPCPGPRYAWAACGKFEYVGTKVSLSFEAISIQLLGPKGVQGKALVSLGAAGVYPIAMGIIKALTQNVNEFVQGKVGGSLSVTSRSLLLKEGTRDEDPSIMPPVQPAHSMLLFHLSPGTQYLVVKVDGADGLPVADTDGGTSNPMVRVRFDGIVQQTDPVMNTFSPAWGHTFYIPIRIPDERIRTNLAYLHTLLPEEMRSKGMLEVEVWHFDSVPSEFLGGYKLDLHQTRYGAPQWKALCQQKAILAKSAGSGDEKDTEEGDETEESMGINPALGKKHETRIFDARRVKLSGSWLPAVAKATITFQAYFIPDFPKKFAYPEQLEGGKRGEKFKTDIRDWEEFWLEFKSNYEVWFPDCPKRRPFTCKYQGAGGEFLPLPMLVTPLALPATLNAPKEVVHWIKCLEFTIPARQRSTGEISRWQEPDDTLSLRRGSVQDHAVLLCCALLGLGKYAYVCKGTLQDGKDHCWVLTKEAGGTITFWETTTGAKYHLAGRWVGEPPHSDKGKLKIAQRWKDSHAYEKWNDEIIVGNRCDMTRTQLLERMDELLTLPISPWKALYTPEMVVSVPYDTIEVVFNGSQAWGNQGNHHPACIYYDMEHDHKAWRELVGEDNKPAVHVGKEVAIPVGPAMSKPTCQALQENIEAEIAESIRMMRMRQGQETNFESNVVLLEQLNSYLEFLENECLLESDWAFDSAGLPIKPWGHRSPFASKEYVSQCQKSWKAYWDRRKQMDKVRAYVPVRTNHVMSGIPLHFSTCDLKEIRKNLLLCKPISEYFTLETDDAQFFVTSRVYPLSGTLASVWVFLGAEIPLKQERVAELARMIADAEHKTTIASLAKPKQSNKKKARRR